jgi:hypothetical protein
MHAARAAKAAGTVANFMVDVEQIVRRSSNRKGLVREKDVRCLLKEGEAP